MANWRTRRLVLVGGFLICLLIVVDNSFPAPSIEDQNQAEPVPVERLPGMPMPTGRWSSAGANSDFFSGPVGWKPLVHHALANNPEIQAARYEARAMGAKVPQAASLPDPTLMTTAYLESIQTAAGAQDVVMSLAQRFPWFGKRALRSEVAWHDAMAAYAQVTLAELRVVEQVKRAYFDLYYLQNAETEIQRLGSRLEDIVRVSEARYKTGQKNMGLENVLQSQVELAKLKTRLVRLGSASAKAHARLEGLLHLDLGNDARLTTLDRLERSESPRAAHVLIELAESCQPELDARRREYLRDRTRITLASRDYWPDVTLSFNWNEIDREGISPVADGRDAYALGVGVNLPIYRSRLDAAAREARCRTTASARRYAAARDDMKTQVRTLYAQWLEQEEILAILESEILPRAHQAFDLSFEAYRTGSLDYERLIDIYRTLLDYRIDLRRREAMREQALASLERMVGCAIASEPE